MKVELNYCFCLCSPHINGTGCCLYSFCFCVVFWTVVPVQRPSRRLQRMRLFPPLNGTDHGSQPSLTTRDRELVSHSRVMCRELTIATSRCRQYTADAVMCRELIIATSRCRQYTADSVMCRELTIATSRCRQYTADSVMCRELTIATSRSRQYTADSVMCRELTIATSRSRQYTADSVMCRELTIATSRSSVGALARIQMDFVLELLNLITSWNVVLFSLVWCSWIVLTFFLVLAYIYWSCMLDFYFLRSLLIALLPNLLITGSQSTTGLWVVKCGTILM